MSMRCNTCHSRLFWHIYMEVIRKSSSVNSNGCTKSQKDSAFMNIDMQFPSLARNLLHIIRTCIRSLKLLQYLHHNNKIVLPAIQHITPNE